MHANSEENPMFLMKPTPQQFQTEHVVHFENQPELQKPFHTH